MFVEDPTAFLKAKFDNMLAHIESSYPGELDTERLRALPAPLLVAAVRVHLVPHAEAIKQGRLLDVAQRLEHAELLRLAERARDDEKLRRYLRLFVELVE
jgi:hypothetical protein